MLRPRSLPKPISWRATIQSICAMVKSRYIGDGHPTFNRNPYNGYIKPLLLGWFSHPLLYGNNGSLGPSTYIYIYKVLKHKLHNPKCSPIIQVELRNTSPTWICLTQIMIDSNKVPISGYFCHGVHHCNLPASWSLWSPNFKIHETTPFITTLQNSLG